MNSINNTLANSAVDELEIPRRRRRSSQERYYGAQAAADIPDDLSTRGNYGHQAPNQPDNLFFMMDEI